MCELTLYFTPGSCALVPLIALEESGERFELEPVKLATGAHRTPAYLSLNPKGKVPVLVADGLPLTENVAILSWLAGRFPAAELLPDPGDLRGRVEILSDLAYAASTLHPLVPRIRMPERLCDTDPARVKAQALQAAQLQFALIDARVARGWWYGARWSAMDAYLYWIWFRMRDAEVDMTSFGNFARHAADSEARPAVQRALARQSAAVAALKG
jgi:Glutathione S-transferase